MVRNTREILPHLPRLELCNHGAAACVVWSCVLHGIATCVAGSNSSGDVHVVKINELNYLHL